MEEGSDFGERKKKQRGRCLVFWSKGGSLSCQESKRLYEGGERKLQEAGKIGFWSKGKRPP